MSHKSEKANQENNVQEEEQLDDSGNSDNNAERYQFRIKNISLNPCFVVIERLPKNLRWFSLKAELDANIGGCVFVKIVRTTYGTSKGKAYAEFEDLQQVKEFKEKYNNKSVWGQKITVQQITICEEFERFLKAEYDQHPKFDNNYH